MDHKERQPRGGKPLSCKCRRGRAPHGGNCACSAGRERGPGHLLPPTSFTHSLTKRAAASAPDVTPTSSQQEGEEARERHSLLKAASGSFHLKLPLANGHAELQGDAAPVPGGHVLLLNWGGWTDEERPAGGSARPRARPCAGESRRRAASRSWGILERGGRRFDTSPLRRPFEVSRSAPFRQGGVSGPDAELPAATRRAVGGAHGPAPRRGPPGVAETPLPASSQPSCALPRAAEPHPPSQAGSGAPCTSDLQVRQTRFDTAIHPLVPLCARPCHAPPPRCCGAWPGRQAGLEKAAAVSMELGFFFFFAKNALKSLMKISY